YRVIRRQCGERLAHLCRGIVTLGQQALRRETIRLRHDDVETDSEGSEAIGRIDQLRQTGARPRPAAELLQAFVINIDDHRGETSYATRSRSLKSVKPEISHRPPSRLAHRDLRQCQQRQHTYRSRAAVVRTEPIEQRPAKPTA